MSPDVFSELCRGKDVLLLSGRKPFPLHPEHHLIPALSHFVAERETESLGILVGF
jgi:hypothetical protein